MGKSYIVIIGLLMGLLQASPSNAATVADCSAGPSTASTVDQPAVTYASAEELAEGVNLAEGIDTFDATDRLFSQTSVKPIGRQQR